MKVRPISIEELIQLIEQRPGITQAEVSDRYDIAPRTVRDVVQRANAHLAGAARIRLRRGRGYILEVIDRQAFEARCLRASKGAASLRTPDGRRLFLMAYLLIRDGWTALRDLSSVLYISRSVLSRDIARIKPRLASCGLTVVTRPRYGLRLEGSETLRRISLVSLVTEHGKTPDAPATLALAQAMAELSSLDTIYHAARTSVTEAMERRRIRVNPNVSETLYAHAYITAMRALQGAHETGDGVGSLDAVRQLGPYPLAGEIADGIRRRLAISLTGGDIAYLVMQIAGRIVLYGTELGDASNQLLLQPACDAAKEIATRVRVDQDGDDDAERSLRDELFAFLVPLSLRLRYRIALRTTIDRTFFKRYPHAYAQAAMAAEVIEGQLGVPVPEPELYNLAVLFAALQTRKEPCASRRRVLVVYAENMIAGELLASRVRSSCPYCVVTDVIDVRSLGGIDASAIGLVLSTVPIEQELSVPVRVCSVFFDEDDAAAVERILR